MSKSALRTAWDAMMRVPPSPTRPCSLPQAFLRIGLIAGLIAASGIGVGIFGWLAHLASVSLLSEQPQDAVGMAILLLAAPFHGGVLALWAYLLAVVLPVTLVATVRTCLFF